MWGSNGRSCEFALAWLMVLTVALDPARCTRLYRVGVEVDSSGLIIKSRTATPEPLKIELRLGPDGIQESPGSKPQPVEPTKPKAGLVPAPAPATTPVSAPATGSPPSNNRKRVVTGKRVAVRVACGGGRINK